MRPFARERLASDLKGAKTMIHCIGQQRLSTTAFPEHEIDKIDEPYAIRSLNQIKRPQEIYSHEQEFEDTNYRSVICSFDIAKQANIRNFIYVSVSGAFPS